MVPRWVIEWEFIEWESVAAEEPSLALWSSIRRQTAESPAHIPSEGLHRLWGCGWGLTWQHRAGFLRRRAGLSGTARTQWIMSRLCDVCYRGRWGLSRATVMKLGPPSEATQALTYESTSIVHHAEFFFFYAAVWKDFTNHSESYSHYGNQGLSWPKYYFFLADLRPQVRAVRTTCRFTWINEILNKTRVLSLYLH